ncbi:hypothetical protein RMATCC62417_10566 [Rhizopus microsporus]|nr:hypothetical protein RMATCC62417_10566 [Rhizopus microsporus]
MQLWKISTLVLLAAKSIYGQDEQAYDYIIAGGGVSGLTVASRLSDNPNVHVLVIEAGPIVEDEFSIYAPAMYGKVIGSDLCPNLPTVPQQHMENRTMQIPAAQLMGGTSAFNGLVWARANLKDYDAWEELGNPGWNGAQLFEYFKRAERFNPPTEDQIRYGARYQPDLHGTNGRLHVSFTNYELPQSGKWNVSMDELGFEVSPDLMNGTIHGFYATVPNTLNPRTMRREDAYEGYIAPFKGRDNLSIMANQTVSRVLLEKNNATGKLVAVGVEYVPSNGDQSHKTVIKARREVILSSGTFGSAKLLQLSGIGPKQVLERAGVDVLLDLPGVGSNLQDHVHGVAVSYTNITGYTTDSVSINQTLAEEQKKVYEENKTGLWTVSPNNLAYPSVQQLFKDTWLQSGRHMASLILNSTETWADYYAKIGASHPELLRRQYEIIASRYQQEHVAPIEINFSPGYGGMKEDIDLEHYKYQTVNHILYVPLSRGYFHIQSTDIQDNGVIDPQYYSHPLDLDIHLISARYGQRILTSRGLGDINQGNIEPKNGKSDEELKKWLIHNVRSDWHPVGTCSMLPRQLNGVVDSELRVYGTSHLRVVDASIIPLHISTHIMQTVYGIAEKAADLIM